ncbi:MAG: sulfurtransferase [Halofilum sp. (in: g-proteobacteria)]|nr:sulfurtransferase [Halofilum sp. (in: g-proteobacteria)]
MCKAIRTLIPLLALLLAPAAALAANPPPLVTADWLHGQLDRDDLVVLDIRNEIDGGSRATYEAGHIPGAVYSDYLGDGWRVERNGVPAMLPPIGDLELLFGRLGIANDSTVVIVPAGVGSTDFGSAARVYWTFKVLGHDAVTILNGGHRAWVEAGHPLESGWYDRMPESFSADYRPELVADTERVQRALDAGVQLVDNRPREQFRGDDKHPASRAAGTIPGAKNLQQQAMTQEGTAYMVDRERLEALLAEAGVNGDGEIITFCNTGHWAAIGWFAMSEIAGYRNVAMYDGSLTAWTQDEGRPLQVSRRGLAGLIDWLTN